MKYFTIPLGILIGLLLAMSIATFADAETLFETDQTAYANTSSCGIRNFASLGHVAIQRIPFPDRDAYMTSMDTRIYRNELQTRDLHFAVLKDEGQTLAYEQYFPASIFPTSNSATTTLQFDEPIFIPKDDLREFFLFMDTTGVGTYSIPGRTRTSIGESPPTFSCIGILNFSREGSWTSKWNGYYASPFRPDWLQALIPNAWASTCEFVTNGATTTAECTDPIIQNPTQDIAVGIVLMFVVSFVTVISLYRKPRRDTR